MLNRETPWRMWGVVIAAMAGAVLLGRALPPLPTPVLVALPVAFGFALTAFLRPFMGLALLTVAMVLSPDIVLAEVPGRDLTVRADDLILAVVLASWFARAAVDRSLPLLRRTSLNRPIGTYLLIALVATWRGSLMDWVSPLKAGFYLLKFIEFYLVYFMTVNVVREDRRARILLWIMIATAVVVMILGYAMLFRGQEVAAPLQGTRTGERATYGGYFVLMIPVLFGIAAAAGPAVLRIGALLTGLAAIPPVVFTQSRASYTGFAVAMLCFGFLAPRGRWLALTLVALLGTAAVLHPPEPVERRIQETLGSPELGGRVIHVFGRDIRTDESTGERLFRYQAILRAWVQHPILGYGVSGPAAVESQYIAVLGETGVLGFLAYGWIFVGLFLVARPPDAGGLWAGVATGFRAGLAGLLAQALTTNTFHIIRITEPLWLMAGLLTVASSSRVRAGVASPATAGLAPAPSS